MDQMLMKEYTMKLATDKLQPLKGRVRLILVDEKEGTVEITPWKDNLIVNACKEAILRRLGNRETYDNEGMITYGAVGTGTTEPQLTDTTLETELERKPVARTSISGLVLTVRVYYSNAEANGDITEFGWFGEAASAAPDSGTMFNRIIISKTKTSAKTLTIEQEIYYT